MKRITLVSVSWLLLSSSWASVTKKISIESTYINAIRHGLLGLGYDLGHQEKSSSNTIDVYTEDADKLLRSINLPVSNYSVEYGQPAKQLVDPDYLNFDETSQLLNGWQKRHNDYFHLFELNQEFGFDPTVDGNQVLGFKLSLNPELQTSLPKILIIGQHHARELMTHHSVLDSALVYLELLEQGDLATLELISKVELWFVPVVNPDGLNYVFSHDNMWRKNRQFINGSRRGVDLNRNYEFKWGQCGRNSSSAWSQVYKGPSASSEVETQVMDRLNQLLKAQFVISYHSSGNEVLYPYVCGDLGTQEKVYYDLRNRLADHLGFRKRLASSSGEDFEHHYAKHGSLSFLIELGSEFQPKFSVYKSEVLPKVLKVIPFLIKEFKQTWLNVLVMDRDRRPIKEAKVELEKSIYFEGETRVTDYFGLYRQRVKSGIHKVSITHQGQTSSQQIEVLANRSNFIEIIMEDIL